MALPKTPKKIKQNKAGKILQVISLLAITLLFGLAALAFILFFEGGKPTIKLVHPENFISKTDSFTIETGDDKSGLRQIKVSVKQGTIEKELLEKSYPRAGYTGQIGPGSDKIDLPFDATALGFKDGEISLTITVKDYSLRGFLSGNTSVGEYKLKLDTSPPQISLLHAEQYISPGGAGIAIYRLSEAEGRHGVVINGQFHIGYPLGAGKEGLYIAYFALPYDTTSLSQTAIEAFDVAGNKASLPFAPIFKPVRFKHDKINISDNFLTTKLPEFQQHYPEMQGTPLEMYLYTNQKLRLNNNAKISAICSVSEGSRLWQGPFHRFPGSPKAGFADGRTYYYNGEAIDEQTHLGVDIASTERAPIRAANKGKVVFGDYLGIYGNMVIIDHGMGLFSLYSHLSQINSKPGDSVDQTTVIGLSGTTGMAAGDHLHFSILINGIFVTPVEWWDPHWIKVTIDDPVAAVKP